MELIIQKFDFGPKILLILYVWTAVVVVYVHGMTSKFALGDIYIYIYN